MDANTNTLKPTITQSNVSEVQLKQIKEEIAKEVNPKNIVETEKLMNDKELLLQTLQKGADKFKKESGRNMTYLEMREMMG